jgi:hypothetical protein
MDLVFISSIRRGFTDAVSGRRAAENRSCRHLLQLSVGSRS